MIDGPHRQPVFDIPVSYEGKDYNFSLFCKDSGVIEYARLIIPNLEKEEIPEKILPFLQILKEHLLSVIRLLLGKSVQLCTVIWVFLEMNESPRLHINITEELERKSIDVVAIRNLFTSTINCREDIRLFVDGIDERIPMQYRFLSLYKIIENEYRTKGKWKRQLNDLLLKHEGLFAEAGFTSKPSSLLHEVRDRCAHIKTGTKREVLGVTHLNHKEAVRVNLLLPILKKICIEIINKKARGQFVFSDIPLTPEQVNAAKIAISS